jgi:hypothetical protein
VERDERRPWFGAAPAMVDGVVAELRLGNEEAEQASGEENGIAMLGIGLQIRCIDEVNWPNQARFQLGDTIRLFFWEKNNNEILAGKSLL